MRASVRLDASLGILSDQAAGSTSDFVDVASDGVRFRSGLDAGHGSTYFIHTDGQVEALSWPRATTLLRDGTTLALYTPDPDIASAWSTDGGKTWRERIWSMAPPGLIDTRTQSDVFIPRPSDAQLAPSVEVVDHWSGGRHALAVYWTENEAASFTGWAVPWVDAPDPPNAVPLPTQASLGDPPRGCDRVATRAWPQVTMPWSAGTRHPMLVEGESFQGSPLVLATARVHAKVSPAEACAEELEAWPGGFGNPYSARIPAADPAHAWLLRGNDRRAISCTFGAVTIAPEALESLAQ